MYGGTYGGGSGSSMLANRSLTVRFKNRKKYCKQNICLYMSSFLKKLKSMDFEFLPLFHISVHIFKKKYPKRLIALTLKAMQSDVVLSKKYSYFHILAHTSTTT